MRRICCVCGILIGLKEPFDDTSETHGYCNKCFKAALLKLTTKKRKGKEGC